MLHIWFSGVEGAHPAHHGLFFVPYIKEITLFDFGDGVAGNAEYFNSNHLNTGTLGIRVRPWKLLTASVEGEIGRSENPLTSAPALSGDLPTRT